MSTYNTTDILFSAFSIFSLLFPVVLIVLFIWFALTVTKQLKKQSMLLEEINEKLNR